MQIEQVDYGRTGHLEIKKRHDVLLKHDYGRTGHLEIRIAQI